MMPSDQTSLKLVFDCLPTPIVQRLEKDARSRQCSAEAVLERAIVYFLDQQGTSFEDCQLEFAEPDQQALK
ncbi:hypothetical protein LEP3755_62800 (plasmid) [Leptolyngbya sp. NIES-3755]|nr:hypothetical protein LEP3755_62800 [Leptolyngbya sp. NIES-3755]